MFPRKRALERIASSAAGQIAMSIASLKLRDVLKDQSIRDPLTGLYNRRFVQEYLDGELPRARRTNRAFTIAFTSWMALPFTSGTAMVCAPMNCAARPPAS